MIFFKHRRSAERDAFSVPRSVQKSIPIKRIYQDGVFQVSGKFSKTWRFFDVNYAVASPEKQRELFMTYCSFLNSLPIGATAKITLFNRQLNQKDFGRTLLMPMQGDRRDLYRNEYNALVLGKAAESNNLIQEKYITVSAEKKSVEEARAFFSRVGTDLTTGLSRMSSSVREMTACGFCTTSIVPARNSYSGSIWRTPCEGAMTSGTASPRTVFPFKKITTSWAIMWGAPCSCGSMPALSPTR